MAIDGTYDIEIKMPMGTQTAKLILETDGTALSGSLDMAFGLQTFSGGTVNGDQVAWHLEVSSPMGKMDLDYQGKVTGDEISGEVQAGAFGSSPFKGKRV